ncbi:MAG: hypothetical protein R2695_06585 [Acidimicrobiales bacterium]
MQAFHIEDDDGVAMPALRIDEPLQATLSDPEPELAGYRAVAELAVAASGAREDRGLLLDLDRIDPVALDILLAATEQHRHRPVEVTVARNGGPGDDGPADVTLVAQEPPAVVDVVAVDRAARSVDTLAQMLGSRADTVTSLDDLLATAVSSALPAETALRYPAEVIRLVEAGTVGIEIPATDRITLTDRRTDLPLTVRNGQTQAITAELRLSAEKLRFPDGDQIVVQLAPATTSSRSPWRRWPRATPATAVLTSPGGRYTLATGTVDIRSTALPASAW